MVFLELRQEPGVHSRVIVSMILQSSCFPVKSGLLSSYEGHLSNLLDAWQVNMDTSRGEAGDPGSLYSCHRDIEIPINFRQESGIIIFLSIELHVPLEVSKGCEASCADKAWT